MRDERTTSLYAVMGNPIAHSLSPLIHQEFAKQTGISLIYNKIEVSEALFEQSVIDFFNRSKGKGLNVTLPFKERAYMMAEIKSSRALQAGASNTLWMKNGKLHADNTDGVGLIRDLNHYTILTDKSIVLLGAGGAARGVIGELLNARPKQLVLSNRTMSKVYVLQKHFPQILACEFGSLTGQYDIIINATSASLQNNAIPLPITVLENHPFCYDLAYSKNKITPFIQWVTSHGSQARDGIGMLIEQAAEAFFIWHGIMPDTAPLRVLLEKA